MLGRNARVGIIRDRGAPRPKGIPTARSKFEAGVRKVIGGGELSDWFEAKQKFRGGGDLGDALLLLSQARCDLGSFRLPEVMHLKVARAILHLPEGLPVPDGPESVRIGQYNEDATAGPFLRSFGVGKKHGLKESIEHVVWQLFDLVGRGELAEERLPFLAARVGYRTKLLSQGDAMEKVTKGDALGRAVMMMDAVEQATSMPLYQVLDKIVQELHDEKGCPWANKVVRASSMWKRMFQEISEYSVVVELDWKKFDRERPREDLLFMIDVIVGCFEPKNEREKRLLSGYKLMLRRALVERALVLDNGTCFTLDGMVPSGSLWTGWLDTGLNILYLTHAFQAAGIDRHLFTPKCAGDDNLTGFTKEISADMLEEGRRNLNIMFNAGIEKSEFLIHHKPYHVTREQACFKPGTDLSKGTSHMIKEAEWRQFSGQMRIDEGSGLSHRWRFNYIGKPKFLSCFWLENGLPVRPAADSKERLLWPEGMHETIEDYEEAVLAMVIDNPFNDHTVNHMMHRYLIIQEVKRQSCMGVKPAEVIWYAKFRSEENMAVPYPTVAYWRRQDKYIELGEQEQEGRWLSEFKDFVGGVTNLYFRNVRGKLDSWMFMEIIRGERAIPEQQIGSDLRDWMTFLQRNGATRKLRAARRYRAQSSTLAVTDVTRGVGGDALRRMFEGCLGGEWNSAEEYALWVSQRITRAA